MKTKLLIFLIAISVTLSVFSITKLVYTNSQIAPKAAVFIAPSIKPKFEVVINSATNTPIPQASVTPVMPTVSKSLLKDISRDIDSMLDLTFEDLFADMVGN